jgi:hypothetical protein
MTFAQPLCAAGFYLAALFCGGSADPVSLRSDASSEIVVADMYMQNPRGSSDALQTSATAQPAKKAKKIKKKKRPTQQGNS